MRLSKGVSVLIQEQHFAQFAHRAVFGLGQRHQHQILQIRQPMGRQQLLVEPVERQLRGIDRKAQHVGKGLARLARRHGCATGGKLRGGLGPVSAGSIGSGWL
jgi:hypothetical protein